MNIIISEEKLNNLIKTWLIGVYGVDLTKCWLDWGSYNCGMGECCDVNYLAIVKEGDNIYQGDVVFKICNLDYFNKKKYRDWEDLPEKCAEEPEVFKKEYVFLVIENEDLFDDLNVTFGENWMGSLVSLLNKEMGLNIKKIVTEI